MNVVILQPSYIPWRGYFDQIHKADIFVFYDDVQYDKHGWRNRNKIKTPDGTKWLTIPVHSKGCIVNNIPINKIRISWDKKWNDSHWSQIDQNYKKAPYYRKYADFLLEFYNRKPILLADFTIDLTIRIAQVLGITNTTFLRSSQLNITGYKADRLLAIIEVLGGTHYISGPSARDYIEEGKLSENGISLEYIEYNYPEYNQLYPPYDPNVSIIDLLFMEGPYASKFIW